MKDDAKIINVAFNLDAKQSTRTYTKKRITEWSRFNDRLMMNVQALNYFYLEENESS